MLNKQEILDKSLGNFSFDTLKGNNPNNWP